MRSEPQESDINSGPYDPQAVAAYAVAQLEKEMAAIDNKKERRAWRRQRGAIVNALVLARYRQGLSQAELAARTGLSRQVISRLESGKGNPNLKTLLKVAGALGVSLVVE